MTARSLIEWLTYDLGETEATQQALIEFLWKIEGEEFSELSELMEAWNELVDIWGTETV